MGLEQTIAGFSRALELGNRESEGHAYRVAEYSLLLSRRLGLSIDDQVDIVWGALLHDVGMLGIPDAIILKPGRLEPQERAIMEQHPVIGKELLASIDILKRASDIPFAHHERWNGAGYPLGLKGEAIPLSARIFAVVDVWDALSTEQPYRPAWSKDEIVGYMADAAGTNFDPEITMEFVTLVTSTDEIEKVLIREPKAPSAVMV